MRWAEGGSCRHDAILRYFGDEAETLAGCGRCDVCREIGGEQVGDEETSLMVRKALSAVARVDRRYGLTAAVKLLAGLPDPRLARAGLDRTPTFGALREHSEPWLTQLLRRCVTAGWVDFTPGDKPIVLLTRSGRAVMKGERPARLVLPREERAGRRAFRAGRAAGRAREATESLPPEAEAVFEALRLLRLELARKESVPAFVVASDRTLRDIALLRPKTRDALLLAHGIGPAKAERYGPQILAVVARASAPRWRSGRRRPRAVFRQHLVERREEEPRVAVREDERRPELEDVVVRAVRAGQHPALAEAVHDVGRLLRGRLEARAVAHQLDPEEEARPAHVADQRVLLREPPQPLEEAVAHAPGPLLQPLLLDDVEHGEAGGAGDGVAAERAEELHAVVERVGDLARRHHGAEREAVPDRLAEHHDVRHDALSLEAPEVRAQPAEARLHLVRDATPPAARTWR